MSKSTQKKIGNIRPPRVQITYDVEVGGAVKQKVLPFVVGVIADLAPGGAMSETRLRDRSFVSVDSDNFDRVMASLAPTLNLSVPNHLSEQSENLSVDLRFSEMDSFSPANVARAVPALAEMLEVRARLNDLLAKLEGNDKLNDLLAEVVLNTEIQEKACDEIRGRRGDESGAN
jgi:type VI secretion system protein ImpB